MVLAAALATDRRPRCSRPTHTSGSRTGSRLRSRSGSSSRRRSPAMTARSTASRAPGPAAIASGAVGRCAARIRAARGGAGARWCWEAARARAAPERARGRDIRGAAGPAVLHISGERDYEALRDRVSRPDYRLLPFTDESARHTARPTWPWPVRAARSGSSRRPGLPAVLVPYPHATADHQTKNAGHLEAAGGAVVVPEAELDRGSGARRGAPGRRRSPASA